MAAPCFVEDLNAAGPGPFVLLAGAGVSLWHPSSLPTWNEFNTALIDEAKARAARALPPKSPLRPSLDALTIADIGTKAFSNALVEMLAGESYFAFIKTLAGSEPNAVHRAVAGLVRRGTIAAIVTTNFDTLFESALAEQGIDADVCSQPRDYARPDRRGVPVLKIHGSADKDTGLIDTVGQKLRGLAPLVHRRLSKLFEQYPVVALGYSGGDLEFAADYLSLRIVPLGANRIWWTVRPKDRDGIDPATQALVSERGKFVPMEQADVLEALGAGPVTLEWNIESRNRRLASLHAEASALFKAHGALNTLAFCMRLLSAAGRTDDAKAIWTFVAGAVKARKRQTVAIVGPAMRALSAEGHRLFGICAQESWACRQLKDIRARTDRGRVAAGAVTELARNEALAYLSVGDTRLRGGDYTGAGLAMQRAMEVCEATGDIALLPAVYRLYGWRDSQRFSEKLDSVRPVRTASEADINYLAQHEDRALNYLMAAEAAALVGGNVDAIESARLRAELFMLLGEYDAALLCLERLAERSDFGVHRETEVRIQSTLGEIDVRQGRIDGAIERWKQCLAGPARGSAMLEAHVQGTIVGRAGFSPKWRSFVLSCCDDLLGKMANGSVPGDARSDLVYTRAYLEQAREGLISLGSKPLDPGFMRELDPGESPEEFMRWPAYYTRQVLIESEFDGDNSGVLDALDSLVWWQFHARLGVRALDAATAHVRRARLDGNDDERFVADVNLNAVRHWLGDADAEAWFLEALRGPRAADAAVRSGLERRLPHKLWNTQAGATPMYARQIELDLDDALALKWASPPTGEAREHAARDRFNLGDFVTGRLLALQAYSSYSDEGDPGGMQRALNLVQDAGQQDQRSPEDPYDLCVYRMPQCAAEGD